jgi:cytochrome P450
MCIGQAFALTEAKLIFAMLLQRFAHLPLAAGQRVCPFFAITMRPRYGLLLDARPLNPPHQPHQQHEQQ